MIIYYYFFLNFFLFLIYFRYATRKDGGAVRKIPHYKKKKKLKTRNSENNARFENVERMIYWATVNLKKTKQNKKHSRPHELIVRIFIIYYYF